MQGMMHFTQLGRWLRDNVVPGLVVSLALIFLAGVAGEIYLRATKPFVKPQWISRFDTELGFTFEPNALIRHTNHIDFWSEQKANTWGFLDYEPPHDVKASGVCRIAFVGDSFVEAAQVPIDKKFHRLLEAGWNAKISGFVLETFALGYSGTGQANQLPWARLIASKKPDLIVLVFVSNDFSNNNAWLEAARNGWHPAHPSRPFVINGRLVRPDPDWRKYLLPGQTGSAQAAWSIESNSITGWLHRKLYRKSFLYSALNRMWVHYAYGAPAYYANVPSALAELKKLPGGREKFGDWNPPEDLTLDQMFLAERMPPVFQEALNDTRVALGLWKQEAKKIGAELAILATHTLRASGLPIPEHAARTRGVNAALLSQRLQGIAQEVNIAVIDQANHIIRNGGDLKKASFPFDGHWNLYGHRTAAEAVAEWLKTHPEACHRGGK